MEYNLQFILDVFDGQDDVYEKQKIINAIDKKTSRIVTPLVFHLVPVLFSFTILSGMTIFLFKVIA